MHRFVHPILCEGSRCYLVVARRDTGSQGLKGSDHRSVDEYAFGAAALALAEGALRWDADFLDPQPPWRRLDRLPQLGHLLGERVPGQKRPRIDN